MNWQAGIMLHPGAQRSEHRIKAPACRETQQAGTVTTSWQSGRQHGARPQHHLGISLRLAPTQHNHCISSRQNNLKSLSEKRGEDQERHLLTSLYDRYINILLTPPWLRPFDFVSQRQETSG